jgi:hypothetical protein
MLTCAANSLACSKGASAHLCGIDKKYLCIRKRNLSENETMNVMADAEIENHSVLNLVSASLFNDVR